MINLNKQLDDKVSSYSYEDLLNLRFKVVLPSAYYRYDEATGAYKNMSSSEDYVKQLIDNGIEVKVSGIIVAKMMLLLLQLQALSAIQRTLWIILFRK